MRPEEGTVKYQPPFEDANMTEILYYPGSRTQTGSVSIGIYPDSMPLLKYEDAAPAHGGPARVMLRPRSLNAFLAGLFWIDAMLERGAIRSAPTLILPFVPGARQDRLNDSGDYLFTLKSIAALINARRFPEVVVLDPHSEVASGLIDRCRVVHAADCISPPAGKYNAVISPDAGAEKRAGAVARKLGVPLLHAWKTRDVRTGAISGFGVEEFPLALGDSPRVLVVDDICDGGGTFVGLAEACCGMTAGSIDLHLFVTHGIFTKGAEPLKAHYSHVYCTDSVAGDRTGVIEIKTCQTLLEKGTL
jgi:ribose-phosphate pyrophosphokinase